MFDARRNDGGDVKILTAVRHGAAARLLDRSHSEGRRPGQLGVRRHNAEDIFAEIEVSIRTQEKAQHYED